MEIGNQIKALRLRRGIIQEAMARHFGISPQAISKWERGAASPDIDMLPGLSAYFGVSIDELFALSDETRMERIQNMLWDVRFLNPADVENERQFLLEKARREPENSKPYEMLANLELHQAAEHNARAEEYAKAAILRAPNSNRAHVALSHAMGGRHVDPRNNTHNALIDYYKSCIAQDPKTTSAYACLIEQLVDDRRLKEAWQYFEQFARYYSGILIPVTHIKLILAEGRTEEAKELWEQIGRDYPESWSAWHWIGDFQTRVGDYAAAKESYRRAIDLLTVPRYEDPVDSLAQVCEMDGDITGALAARREQLYISMEDWGDSSGESVDYIRREIARLERRI